MWAGHVGQSKHVVTPQLDVTMASIMSMEPRRCGVRRGHLWMYEKQMSASRTRASDHSAIAVLPVAIAISLYSAGPTHVSPSISSAGHEAKETMHFALQWPGYCSAATWSKVRRPQCVVALCTLHTMHAASGRAHSTCYAYCRVRRCGDNWLTVGFSWGETTIFGVPAGL